MTDPLERERPASLASYVSAMSPSGISDHNMSGGWRVIVAKHGEHIANWYYHTGDSPRIKIALRYEAERRLMMWRKAKP